MNLHPGNFLRHANLPKCPRELCYEWSESQGLVITKALGPNVGGLWSSAVRQGNSPCKP